MFSPWLPHFKYPQNLIPRIGVRTILFATQEFSHFPPIIFYQTLKTNLKQPANNNVLPVQAHLLNLHPETELKRFFISNTQVYKENPAYFQHRLLYKLLQWVYKLIMRLI